MMTSSSNGGFTPWSARPLAGPTPPVDVTLFALPPIGPHRREPSPRFDDELVTGPLQDEAEVAYARGLADGLRQGADEERERLQAPITALEGLLQSIETARVEFQHDQERNLYGLAVALARHLIQREIEVDQSIVRNLVHEALALLPRDESLEIRMHPSDLSVLSEGPDEVGRTRGELQVHWISDDTLERGSFQIESPLRLVDGRTDVALRQLYEQLAYE